MYLMYLKNILLPVTPKSMDRTGKNRNTTMTLINDGEINVLKAEGLESIKFEALLPNQLYSFAKYKGSFHNAEWFMKKFEKLKNKPFQLILTRERADNTKIFNTNIKVAIEKIDYAESSANGTDIVAKFELKKYKIYGLKSYEITTNTSNTEVVQLSETKRDTSTSPEPTSSTTYIVKSGDNLWAIAKHFYGDGSLYTLIFNANKDKISIPSLIYPGQEFIIPAKG